MNNACYTKMIFLASMIQQNVLSMYSQNGGDLPSNKIQNIYKVILRLTQADGLVFLVFPKCNIIIQNIKNVSKYCSAGVYLMAVGVKRKFGRLV